MPLFYVCAAFLAGAAAAPGLAIPAGVWLAGSGACTTAAALLLKRARTAPGIRLHRWLPLLGRLRLDPAAVPPALIRLLPLLAAAGFMLGAGRWAASQPALDDPGFIASFNDQATRYTVIGTLAAPPDVRDTYTNLRVEAEEIRPAGGVRHLPVRGMVLARVDGVPGWGYGDRVAVTGKLQTPPEAEDFSYREYLSRQGIYTYLPFAEAARLEGRGGSPLLRILFQLKSQAHAVLKALFPDPEGSLLAGILLGLDRGLAPDLEDAFRDTGTSHIIAISGFNISIIAAIVTSVFGRVLGRRLGGPFAVLAVFGYTILVGADAAVLRAAVMGSLAILLRQSGRSSAGLNSLTITASVMVFMNPQVLADIGFQLSFAATLGLVLYAEPLTRATAGWAVRYWRISTVRKALPVFSDAVLLTLAAQVTTLPIILYHFGRLSLSAFLVNPLILPVQPAVMIMGGIAMLAGMAWLPAGGMLAPAALPFVSYTIRLVELFSRLRWGVMVVGRLAPGAAVALGIGPALLRGAGDRLRQALPAARMLLALALLGAVVLTWRTALGSGMGRLRVWVLDVGMGEAILVQTPEDRWVLVNGGPSAVRLSDQLGRRLPVLHRELDWLVVAGTSDAQLGALPGMLEQYPPNGVLWAGLQNNTQEIRNMQDMMNNMGLEPVGMQPGQALDLGAGAALEVVDTTPRGAVLLLRWRSFRLLLPTGADFETVERRSPPVSAVLLADSGFAPLNPPAWLENLQPDFALLSVEAGNREGLPDPAVLELLSGRTVLRTDRDGWIELATDGDRIWVTTAEQLPAR